MSTFEHVATQIHSALHLADAARQSLKSAVEFVDQAIQVLKPVLDGTTDAAALQAWASLEQARSMLSEQQARITSAEICVRSYLTLIGADSPAGYVNESLPTTTSLESGYRNRESAVIKKIRAELPPDVEPRSGQKTHGRWIDADGTVHAETSGKDEKYDEVVRFLKSVNSRRMLVVASHVEIKLAAHMRKNAIRSIILALNNVPCTGELGCEALISVILPKGYSLTVYGSDGFVQKYEGGGTSPWVP
ncbi:DddA-like double-stranded DNA deaminase toxin [Actinokineospora sp.]|uniref:DddA-like double-stranded DNA deaminase toxin n=1 Tax=Actinokineospora sp. TaxID=1872133 RepID=UPI0040379548